MGNGGSTTASYDSMQGDPSRNILLASDLHPEREPSGFRNKLRYIIRNNLEEIAEEHECDEIWYDGDLGSYQDVKALAYSDKDDPADVPVDRIKFGVGDGDRYKEGKERGTQDCWYSEMLEGERFDAEWVEYGKKFVTNVLTEDPYTIEMGHDWDEEFEEDRDPSAGAPSYLEVPKIVVLADEHQPAAGVVQNSLVITLGSTYQHYSVHPHVKDKFPETSVHVLKINGPDIGVDLIDYDTGEVYERQRFTFTGDKFVEEDIDVADQEFEEALTGDDIIDVNDRFKSAPKIFT